MLQYFFHNQYALLENQKLHLIHLKNLFVNYSDHKELFDNYYNLKPYLILHEQMEYEILLNNYHNTKPNDN